ncbi:MAG: LapA family protein [Acidimicrobiia bacterium]
MADLDRTGGSGISPKLVVFGILAVLLVWFMLINTESVSVSWIFGTSEIPLIWVIVGSAVLGAVIGWIFTLTRRGRD